MILGIGNPSADYSFSSDYFTGTPPKTIKSDWSATLTVKKDSSTVYQYSTIQANEGLVNGLGEFWAGWVIMPGTEAGNLDRDDFYDGDGCYTFEVQIDNSLGESYTRHKFSNRVLLGFKRSWMMIPVMISLQKHADCY